MSRRKLLFSKKLIQAKKAGQNLSKVISDNMKSKKLIKFVEGFWNKLSK